MTTTVVDSREDVRVNPGEMKANVRLVLTGPDGKVKYDEVHNAVTTKGKEGIADNLLAAPSVGKPTHMGIGTGTGGTTALNAELDRNALTSKTRLGAVVTMVADWAAGDGTGSITEAGVFNQSSTGDMWFYTSFAVVTKGAGDQLQITWTVTIT